MFFFLVHFFLQQKKLKSKSRSFKILKMVNKCNVVGCFTNHPGYNTGAVFKLPKDEELRPRWIKFLNRKDSNELKNIFICERHFEEEYLNKCGSRIRLVMDKKPVPTIFTQEENVPQSLLPTVQKIRKPPAKRVFQEDELGRFKELDQIDEFCQVNESLLSRLEQGFTFMKKENHVLFYKLEFEGLASPQVTYCIRVDTDLRVKLYYKGYPVPLPQWFRKSRKTILSSASMLQNFVSYLKAETVESSSIFEELQQLKYRRCHTYSANLLRYALLLRYTSLPAYNLLSEEFHLPSVSHLKKLTAGNIDTFSSLKALAEGGSISTDVILIFDEIYLQKCEEYCGGQSIGSDENGDLYKGVVCFMVVGLKENVSYVIKSVPEKEISGELLKNEIIDCINSLQENGFFVRGVVCDNHASNVLAFKELLRTYGCSESDLYIKINNMKIFLFFDVVHLIKNIRNNLLNKRRFLFPEFSCLTLHDRVFVSGGEISWSLLHKVHEKDEMLQANLKAAYKLSPRVLHPGNCKQSVPVALAVFDPSTSAAIERYFPDKKDAAEFLNLINVWWTISNSKVMKNSQHSLGNAAVLNDGKPQFLREFADWIEKWDELKLTNCDKFTLSAQTSSALRRTLRCHASLIEDLLSDNYNFVLTARFQSDPLEKRYGQYRQMSGGRFLVSLKDVQCSEKILKIKSLLKEGISIDEDVKVLESYSDELKGFLARFESLVRSSDSVHLSEESRDISDYIAGHIAHKAEAITTGCCSDELLTCNPSKSEYKYIHLLSRGGLKFPSEGLSHLVAKSFALLDVGADIIRQSTIPSRTVGINILEHFLGEDRVPGCNEHYSAISSLVIRTVTNIFFNDQRKRTTEAVLKDKVAAFKKSKREK